MAKFLPWIGGLLFGAFCLVCSEWIKEFGKSSFKWLEGWFQSKKKHEQTPIYEKQNEHLYEKRKELLPLLNTRLIELMALCDTCEAEAVFGNHQEKSLSHTKLTNAYDDAATFYNHNKVYFPITSLAVFDTYFKAVLRYTVAYSKNVLTPHIAEFNVSESEATKRLNTFLNGNYLEKVGKTKIAAAHEIRVILETNKGTESKVTA